MLQRLLHPEVTAEDGTGEEGREARERDCAAIVNVQNFQVPLNIIYIFFPLFSAIAGWDEHLSFMRTHQECCLTILPTAVSMLYK